MVVVRESPAAKQSPSKSTAQWPPRSPFQALLSSPSGRRKWQDRREQGQEQARGRDRSISPSPVKSSSRKLQAVSLPSPEVDEGEGQGEGEGEGDGEGMEEDDDEETLRLKMEAIQAKLKLKALQRKKKEQAAAGESRRPEAASTSPRKGQGPAQAHRPSASVPDVGRGKVEVEVELSPAKDRIAPQEPVSPARRRLGLSTAANASDISLKRARDGTHIRRSESVRSAMDLDRDRDRPKKSFSERLRETRDEADEREAKHDWRERTRSKGFSQRESAFTTTKQKLESAQERPSSGRGSQPSEPSSIFRSKSTPARATPPIKSRANTTFNPPRPASQQPVPPPAPDSDSDLSIVPPTTNNDTSPSSYDPFSELHLHKRHIPHSVVAREMEGKEIYTLPRLLKEVKAPHFDPPDGADDSGDFVVFALLASKSTPYDHKPPHKTSDAGKPQEDADAPCNKFMVLKLTDLKWEVDCFLFGTAFDQFWKLTEGTLLALLNPSILPPKKGNQHPGQFSLKLGSSEDCVMEIGLARDLGHCSAVRKDGRACGEWVDRRRTEICEFHLNLFVEKQRKGRMEVNTMWRGTGNSNTHHQDQNPSKPWKPHHAASQPRDQGGWHAEMHRRKGVSAHREYGTLYAVPPSTSSASASAASLLDAEDRQRVDAYEAGEASRRRVAAAQRERDLRRRLGAMGSGVGREYLAASGAGAGGAAAGGSGGAVARAGAEREGDRGGGRRQRAAAGAGDDGGREGWFEKPSAAELGLVGRDATAAHLSPAKDRKLHFGVGAVSGTTGRGAVGWGGATRRGGLGGLPLSQPQPLPPPQQRRAPGSPGKDGGKEGGKEGGVFRGPTRLEQVRSRLEGVAGAAGGASAGAGSSSSSSSSAAVRPPAIRPRSQDGGGGGSLSSASPAKKRARFMLEEKGLREPGRESGVGVGVGVGKGKGDDGDDDDDDDDDDGLEIV